MGDTSALGLCVTPSSLSTRGRGLSMTSAQLRMRSSSNSLPTGVFAGGGTRLDRFLALYPKLRFIGDFEYEKKYVVLRDNAPPACSVFNVEFSPQGNYLVAALADGRVLLADPATHKLQHAVSAHLFCTNCVCFIDNNSFATCSDDSCVKVWDVRSLKTPLHARDDLHSNWVKSIQYDSTSRCLLSSGFDQKVCLWPLNGSAQATAELKTSIDYNGRNTFLMRMKLSPNAKLLCVGLFEGYNSLPDDFYEDEELDFPEDGCRLEVFKDVRLDEHGLDVARYTVQNISHWPEGTTFITSMQMFSDNRHILSRCSSLFNEEWLCVHSLDSGKMLYRIEESNLPHGIVKEVGLSPDDRALCSPFGNRVRVMGLGAGLPSMEEIAHCGGGGGDAGDTPRPLSEIVDVKTPYCPAAAVLSCRFSPTQMLLAAGDVDGNIFLAQPRL